jgi:hypothetical protein
MISNHVAFISYASEDKNIAFRTVNALEKENIKCWITPRDVSGGELFVDSIMQAIKQCELLIVLISKYSNISRFVRREVGTAFDNDKVLVPIRVENIEPEGELKFYLGDHHWIEIWDKPGELYLFEILQEVKKLIKKGDYLPKPRPLPESLPPGVFQLKLTEEKNKSELLKFMQFLSVMDESIKPPIKRRASTARWLKDYTQYIQNYLKSDSVKKWLTNRFELILNRPFSLQNLNLIDALYILPPLNEEFDQVYDNLVNIGRGVIIGSKFSGKKLFTLYLSYHWSLLQSNKILFVEDPKIFSVDEWNSIELNLKSQSSNQDKEKKILFIIFNTSKIDSNIELNIKRILNLTSSTNLSILWVNENKNKEKVDVTYFQDLLRLPKQSDIMEINQDNHWKKLYLIWLNTMLNTIFKININILTDSINNFESIKELQDSLDIFLILKIRQLFDHENHDQIIKEINIEVKNVILHQYLVDSYLRLYNSDYVIEILEQKKDFYLDHNNLGMWYYNYGSALQLKGEDENANEKFEKALEYLDSDIHKEVIKEIREWTGKTINFTKE